MTTQLGKSASRVRVVSRQNLSSAATAYLSSIHLSTVASDPCLILCTRATSHSWGGGGGSGLEMGPTTSEELWLALA